MRILRTTIRRFLFVVVLVAADLAYIRGPINVNFLIAAPVLQVCLFKVVSSCGSIHTFWIGFGVFGWAGVIVLLSGIGPLWFGFLDRWLNDGIGSIIESHPGAGRALAMVILKEAHLSDWRHALGLLPESLIAGMPILIFASMGGLLAVFLASRRSRTERTPLDSPCSPAMIDG